MLWPFDTKTLSLGVPLIIKFINGIGITDSMVDLGEYYKKNLRETKRKVKESVSDDLLIIQCINNIEDIGRVINTLVKRLREWYELYLPEFSKRTFDHEKFVDSILKFEKKALMKEFEIKETMGADLGREDLKPILNLAQSIKELYKLKSGQENYLKNRMERVCPNLTKTAGAAIGAKLIEQAGSLRHLAELPSSTVQLLGAEKALFRHLKNKKFRPPKYGVIMAHQTIQNSKRDEKGKAARHLASKISIAVKVDYFRK